jgi:hypothetical protein
MSRAAETASAARILKRIRAEDAARRAAAPPVAHARTTEFVVNCLPEDDINAPAFEIKVVYRGRDLWAVKRYSSCLSSSGEWDYEHIPSEREDEWLATHRFPLARALELARAAAPDVTVNGHTVTEALADAKARSLNTPTEEQPC